MRSSRLIFDTLSKKPYIELGLSMAETISILTIVFAFSLFGGSLLVLFRYWK